MTSVRHTNGDYLTDATVPTMTGDFIFGCWVHATAAGYAAADNNGLFEIGLNPADHNLGLAVDPGANNLLVYAYNGGIDAINFGTANSEAWIFVAIQHASGSSNYTVRSRLENVTTFTNVGTLSVGEQLTANTVTIGRSIFFGNSIDSSSWRFFLQATTMNDATLLTASQAFQTFPPAGTNLHALDLDSPTNAEVNAGTGGNFTVTGTLGTDATEPTESGGGGAGTPNPPGIPSRQNRSLLGVGFSPRIARPTPREIRAYSFGCSP